MMVLNPALGIWPLALIVLLLAVLAWFRLPAATRSVRMLVEQVGICGLLAAGCRASTLDDAICCLSCSVALFLLWVWERTDLIPTRYTRAYARTRKECPNDDDD